MRNRHLLLVLLAGLSLAPSALAQGTRKDDIVLNRDGRPVPGAPIRVCTAAATGTPCSPLASIYTDIALTVPIAQPGFQTDSLGNYYFYALNGLYVIQITVGTSVLEQRDTLLACAGICAGPFTFSTLTVTGNTTLSGRFFADIIFDTASNKSIGMQPASATARSLTIQAGTPSGSTKGGTLFLFGGAQGVSGTGGDVVVEGGSPGAGGGSVTVRGTGTGNVTLGTASGAPFAVLSSVNIPSLNASLLGGATFAAPGPIGTGTPNTIVGTTLTGNGQLFIKSDGDVAVFSTAAGITKAILNTTTSVVLALGAGASGSCLDLSIHSDNFTTQKARISCTSGAFNLAGQITSTLASGTPPFSITSPTEVATLNVAAWHGVTPTNSPSNTFVCTATSSSSCTWAVPAAGAIANVAANVTIVTTTTTTTSVQTLQTGTIGAGTATVGSQYRFTAKTEYTNGDSAVSKNSVHGWGLDGSLIGTTCQNTTVTFGASAQAYIELEITILTTGAGGTAVIVTRCSPSIIGTAQWAMTATTVGFDTTASHTVSQRLNQTATTDAVSTFIGRFLFGSKLN